MVRILFDGCSQCIYITERLKNKLKLRTIRQEGVIIERFASDEGLVKTLDVVQLCVPAKNGKYSIYVEALCMPHLCSPLRNPKIQVIKEKYEYLRNIPVDFAALDGPSEISVLVGLDYYYSIVTGNLVKGEGAGPVAIESILGWILCGPTNLDATRDHEILTNLITMKDEKDATFKEDDLRRELHNFWEMEAVGTSNVDQVYEQFKLDITFNGERYVTKLPFKPHADIIPDNFSLSFKRLQSLEKKFSCNPKLKEQ